MVEYRIIPEHRPKPVVPQEISNLLDPVKQIVRSGMDRILHDGHTVHSPFRDGAYLFNTQEVVLYTNRNVLLVRAFNTESTPTGVRLFGSTESGLVIESMVYERNKPDHEGMSVQVARREEEVIPDTVVHLRKYTPEDLYTLAEELGSAKRATRRKYSFAENSVANIEANAYLK